MFLSVIIPAFNEGKSIKKNIEEVCSFCERMGFKYEIIVIDDGSTDGTFQKIPAQENVSKIKSPINMGKGHSLRLGLEKAKGEAFYLCDADLQISLSSLPKMIELLRKSDLVICSRVYDDKESVPPFWRIVMGNLSSLLINMVLGIGIGDIQCGFKLLSPKAKDLFLRTKLPRWGTDFEFLLLVKQNKLVIQKQNATCRRAQTSRVRIGSYFSTLIDLLWVFWRYRVLSRID